MSGSAWEAPQVTVAPYACRDELSRGRRYPEPPPPWRSEYQRDRDRIIHSSAFRRLEYKTQVFVNHEGDLFRTRLTHSIEVAQIARTIARALRLNEDLTEAIALAHDLGHTPFGHAGQDALNACMREFGGFEHNLQSLRVVDELEEKYADFPGLNLTYEAREGILKHCSPNSAEGLGELGQRFLDGLRPSLEAQLVDLADEIAYNSHDVDDGLRAGLLDVTQLQEVGLCRERLAEVQSSHPNISRRRLTHELVRGLINRQVSDLLETSLANLRERSPTTPEQARRLPTLIVFSAEMVEQHLELKRFLRRQLYQHYRVRRMTTKAVRVVRELFEAFLTDPSLMPPEHWARAQGLRQERGEGGVARAVADYVAGMTDRYAIAEHERLFDPKRLT